MLTRLRFGFGVPLVFPNVNLITTYLVLVCHWFMPWVLDTGAIEVVANYNFNNKHSISHSVGQSSL